MKVAICMIFTNGEVMAFNENGEQIPELQGFIFNVANKLKKSCDENTEFSFAQWGGNKLDCNFKWWFEKKECA